ncbi:type VI secretion system baseplate subunit TssE [Pseudomonas mandelii]|uniref:type VI secretion system baseplate subunit TssE n=1 Tax=Pseudomonas mandelii TaxID=75612 RepID=UPI00224B0B05|nr:type VI secretion system baseplate subunit TssE [Pseudomonas mandelii]MCX2900414.1 type VI secretion system baseplate subunit TssE [Pseudomonas mandelii]
MPDLNPSLYETLLQNFTGDLELHQVAEEDQYTLSVLDNVQRILNSRAGTLAHLADYGLPDMGSTLQGLPASSHNLMKTIARTLTLYEPRLLSVHIELLPQSLPGHLEYGLDLRLESGRQVSFGTTLAPEGNVLVRHLKRQSWLAKTYP